MITTTYDSRNQPNTTAGMLGTNQTTYNEGTSYWPHGAVNSYRYGNGSDGNNVVPTYIYNSRLQMSNMFATLNNDNSRFIWNYVPSWGTTDNNGTLRSAWEGYGPPSASSALTWLSQTYTYDGLNRLTHVEDSGGYTRDFGYDAYGNMWISGYTTIAPVGNPPSSSAGYNANNQVTTGGARFDGAGNQIAINGDAMAYDAENRQISAADSVSQLSETYSYDGAGRRVQKGVSGGTGTVYVYDAFDQLAAEYSNGSNNAPCTTCYLTWDQLGSTRLVTDQNANVVSWHDYLPFGEEIQANTVGRNGQWGSNADATQKFTGKERDSETGLDFFGARYYRSALGRFTSPDPTFLNIRKVFNPQRWNLYGYVVNNPLKFVDPDGNEAVSVYYPGYQVGVHASLSLPLGHAGVVVVDKNGSTHYFEYGRYAPAGAGGDVAQGITRTVDTPSVQRDASGNITPDSMEALLKSLSTNSGKQGEVDAVVLNTSDAEDAAIEAYLEQRVAENSDPNRQHYSISHAHNCGTLVCDALNASGHKSPTAHGLQDPSCVFDQFLFFPGDYGVKQFDTYKPKEKVTSQFCYTDPSTGKTVCQ